MKNIKGLLKNKKVLGGIALGAVTVALLLVSRKSVTTVEVEGDLIIPSAE